MANMVTTFANQLTSLSLLYPNLKQNVLPKHNSRSTISKKSFKSENIHLDANGF